MQTSTQRLEAFKTVCKSCESEEHTLCNGRVKAGKEPCGCPLLPAHGIYPPASTVRIILAEG